MMIIVFPLTKVALNDHLAKRKALQINEVMKVFVVIKKIIEESMKGCCWGEV